MYAILSDSNGFQDKHHRFSSYIISSSANTTFACPGSSTHELLRRLDGCSHAVTSVVAGWTEYLTADRARLHARCSGVVPAPWESVRDLGVFTAQCGGVRLDGGGMDGGSVDTPAPTAHGRPRPFPTVPDSTRSPFVAGSITVGGGLNAHWRCGGRRSRPIDSLLL